MLWDLLGESKAPQKRALPDTPEDADRAEILGRKQAHECDYETDCTPLYTHIESAVNEEAWEPIVKYLDTGKWTPSIFDAENAALVANNLFLGEKMPEEAPIAEQARTWVTRFDSEDPSKVRWSQLPLHLAIVCNAPFSVVGRLIELYPQAVRCTDDQRMLPIHLALRHGASDDVVAYLLMQFPESVNVKGKDDRMPITCALRAESKVRGKILEIFVKKTKMKHKIALGGGTPVEREISLLKSQLEAKTLAFENADAKLSGLETFKTEMETELAKKEEEIELLKESGSDVTASAIGDLKSKQLVDEIALQHKIDSLEAEKKDLQASERKALSAESNLLLELEKVAKAVDTTDSSNLKKLKQDVKLTQKKLLEENRRDAQMQIDMLETDLKKNMKPTDGKPNKEVRAMENTVAQLRNAANGTQSNGELVSLRREVVTLRTELRERAEAAKAKRELEEMKSAMVAELKNPEGKTKEDIAALHRVATNVDDLEAKTPEELNTMKEEVTTVKKQMQEKELKQKTHMDVKELKLSLESELQVAKGVTYKELALTKKTLDTIQEELNKDISSDDLLALRKEVTHLKDEVKHKEQTAKVREEMKQIKSSLEAELKNPEGKTTGEMLSLKKAVKSVDDKTIAALSLDELSVKKGGLQKLKDEMDLKEKANETRQELQSLKKTLEENEKEWQGKNRDDITVMKNAVDEMSVAPLEKKNAAELKKLKTEMQSLRDQVKVTEEATKTKQELDALKATLEDALKSSEGKTADELYAMKKAVDSINVEQLEIRDKEEWDMIRSELNALKNDLKTKEAGEGLLKKEIAELKAQLPPKSAGKNGSTKKKKSWKKRVSFFRFRRNKDDASASTSVVPTSAPKSPVSSYPQPSGSPVHQETAARDDTEEVHDDGEDDVRTIHPPSVHPGAQTEDDGAESDDERADDKSLISAMASKVSMKSSSKSQADDASSSSKVSRFSRKSHATEKTSHTLKSPGTYVDAATGEMVYSEEKKTDEGRHPFSDAVSV